MGKSDKKGKPPPDRPARPDGAPAKNGQAPARKPAPPVRSDKNKNENKPNENKNEKNKAPPTGLDAMKAALAEAADAAPKEARPRARRASVPPRSRPDRRPAPAPEPEAPESSAQPTQRQPPALVDESSPPTRRSTPRPPASAHADVVVPPLPRVRIEQAPPLEVPVESATNAAPAEPPRTTSGEATDDDEPSFSARPTERHLHGAGETPADRRRDAGAPCLTPGYDLDGETLTQVAPIAATAPALRSDSDLPVPSRPASVPPAPPAATSVEDLEQQIRDLESRLDRMIRQKERAIGASSVPAPPPAHPSAPSSTPAREREREPEPAEAAGVFDTARELLSTDYYLRQWGKMGMRNRSEEVDEFGLDPKYEARWQPFFDFLYRHYFRVDAEGTSNIPEQGRCLIVANHSGGPLPYDGPMLRTAVKRDHPQQREVRWLAEDFIYYLPFVGAAMNRIGAVRACQENAERLLARGNAVAVFPEGAKGMGKLYRDRYQLQRFGRGGFIRLSLRTQTPIVPCAIVGAEEANPIMYRIEAFTKALGLPYLPITPTFPALGPLGLVPAPTKWKIRFGEPISFDEHGVESADDEILVGRLSDRVRTTIQSMLDRTLSERGSIWFG